MTRLSRAFVSDSGRRLLLYRLRTIRVNCSRFFGALLGRPRILFVPDTPPESSLLYKVCLHLGYGATSRRWRRHELAMRWDDRTIIIDGSTDEVSATVLNSGCIDLRKSTVQRVFEDVFGYPLEVDPRQHAGPCVEKSEWNAAHDGRVLCAPLEPSPDKVYQRLIDTDDGHGPVDLRVPVVGDAVPFVYERRRPLGSRFHGSASTVIRETRDVLSVSEQRSLLMLCNRLELDFGEIDALRDKIDGRLYIVDVNTTPAGPPKQLPPEQYDEAIFRTAAVFASRVLPVGLPSVYSRPRWADRDSAPTSWSSNRLGERRAAAIKRSWRDARQYRLENSLATTREHHVGRT